MPIANTTAAESTANERLEARVTARQKALFREAANLQGVTLTDFIVSSVHQAAVRALEARHLLDLSRGDQHAFIQAVLRPAAANARLRRAWSKHARAETQTRVAKVRRKVRRRGRG